MGDKEKINISERVWGFFASVKLTIVVFIILALTSIIGTIIEQNAEPASNIRLLAKFFGDSLAPTVYNIFLKLGFMDMYHSWWFILLLVLFCTNLIVCSLERLPKTLKLINAPLKPLEDNVIKTLPIRKELRVKADPKTVRNEVLKGLAMAGFRRVSEAKDANSIQLYSEKGKYSRLGLYVVHLSVLLIFIGAILGAWFGFGGFLNLPEGGSSDVAYTRGGKTIPLGFTIKCNWYDTRYYPWSDTPQEFQSEVSIIEGGREVLKKLIKVNHPLTYRGITFYQSSYGMIPEAVGEFQIKVIPNGGEERVLHLKLGDTFEIPGTKIKGTIANFSPALGRDPLTGRLYTYAEEMVNPAIGVKFSEGGKDTFAGWILRRYPETGILPEGHKIEFIDYWGVEYTGLQVSKDPGVWLIYLACAIMTVGLYVAFFMSHRKIWIGLFNEKGSIRISVGGSVSKNRLSFEKDIEKLLARLLQTIEGRSKR